MSDLIVGVGITTSAAPGADPLGEALAAEALGYDFVSASDHPTAPATYETVALLTWIAARTTRIGVATRVLGTPFRRPALVARTAESLQRLSDGRLILGLGAGHSDEEIVALGGPALTPGQKVAGLADAITTMRRTWSDGRPIPIWLGTYGPKALAVTGRLADGWIPSLDFAPPPRVPELLDRIRTAAVDAGRDPGAVRAIYNVPVRIGPGRDPGTVAGTAAEVVEQLRGFVDLGFTGFNLQPADSQVRAIAEDVLPALRAHS